MRVPQHIVDARRERLRGLIRHDGFLPIADICRSLRISEATARRDLSAIEADGHITRTYGGALADYNTSFASLGERAKRARTAKAMIGRAAIKQTPSGGTIFLDAGTTVMAIARLIARRRNQALTVVTNNLAIASVLGGAPGVTLHLLGGVFLHRQATLFGDKAVGALREWNFDVALLGGEGMNSDGIWNSHPDVVRLQRAALERARESIFCLDSSKLNQVTPHRVANWKEVGHLVTDASPEQLQAARIPLRKPRIYPAHL